MGIAAAALLCAGGAGADEAPEPAALVTVSATTSLYRNDPGAGVSGFVEVRFVMADGWHIYWRNPGESGSPTKLTLTLPDGVTAGALRWPAPQRMVAGGDVLDYVYAGETTILVPFRSSRGLGNQPIPVHADWFVCNEDKCLIGAGDTEATVTAPTDLSTAHATATRLPAPLPPPGFATSWRGAKLAIRVPEAASLTFFEDSPSDTMPRAVNPLRDGAAEGDRLILEFAPETVAPGRVVTGVLTVKRKDGTLTHHELSIPVSGSAIGSDSPQPTPKTSDSK